jgi:hypothetical protein
VVQFDKEASQTRDTTALLAQILRCAKNACSGMTNKLHYRNDCSAEALRHPKSRDFSKSYF